MFKEEERIKINKDAWNIVAPQFFEGSFTNLEYGMYAPSEEELNFLGDLKGKVILEVGCGSGHTLEYMARAGAGELFGVDLSTAQLESAKKVNSQFNIPITLIESPMEELKGVPRNYFDIAISIYALGWTVNLSKTLSNIFDALKPGGVFVFSWEHPVHSLLEYRDGKLVFKRSYVEEGYEKHESWRTVSIVMHYRKLSTYINGLIKAGFIIDQVVEETRIPENDTGEPNQWYSAEKARTLPPDLIIKSHKPDFNIG
ncbi:class I SAM-dependent methyltransferase [Paenibacillus aurantius]|uniref:Class I SAM-dependent methyltransferase n=1 Tax=Paenibacillus aurantius TaxID=2918900 RepID=A0AA96LAL9_9BACL|nr:class I SAM-dependent methyltransferase [Paenibacillus aurantius]WNQ09623.1 class I SAM-dependent methyltransferase [Paenibacillus aurantius]